ncbi:hypothetical protein GOBAR_AA07359 [Gossypium barbadense]|uniref:Uncharacterized protein n=1 Tax=Gossypium barbadense TaxID=3634 RepID=A0A2P5YCE1_GOSBA|nr:hypothetical protein GOBAR_AA07359 [Gossypium barbadense]
MALHVMRTHRLSHHPSIVQFMRRLHTLTSLSTLLDLISSVFSVLITLMLLYIRFNLSASAREGYGACDHSSGLDLPFS